MPAPTPHQEAPQEAPQKAGPGPEGFGAPFHNHIMEGGPKPQPATLPGHQDTRHCRRGVARPNPGEPLEEAASTGRGQSRKLAGEEACGWEPEAEAGLAPED